MQEVGRQVLGPVPIVEAEGSRETWSWDTKLNALDDSSPPTSLGPVDSSLEEVIEQQVLEVGLSTVGLGYICKEDRTDNAPTAPHESDGGVVQLPFIFFGSLPTKFQLFLGDRGG